MKVLRTDTAEQVIGLIRPDSENEMFEFPHPTDPSRTVMITGRDVLKIAAIVKQFAR